MRMVDIVFFSSPNGLGHVTRDFAISQYLPETSTKFVTANASVPFLKQMGANVEEGLDCPKFVVENGLLSQPTKWLLDFYKYHKECKKIAQSHIEQEHPHLVLSDEDYAALDVAQRQNIPSILITNVFELKFTRGFGSIIEKTMNRGMKNIMKKCDTVIVPLEGYDYDNFRFVGPIVRQINSSREELRKKFSFNKKTIVVSVGGTDAGNFLIERTLEAHSKIKDTVDLVIVSGPSMNKNYIDNIRNLGFVNNLHEIIFAADLLICLAGASTVSESITYGTPGIFIPIKNHFEQEENANRWGFSHDDINQLDTLIAQKLEEPRIPQKNEGAQKAAEIIKQLMP